MTLSEFAIIRYAARLMTADELKVATLLAQAADAGDDNANAAVRHMAYEVLMERGNDHSSDGNKKLL